MQQSRRILILALSALFVASAFAQEKNELAVTYGRTFIGHQVVSGTGGSEAISFGHGNTFGFNYARLLKDGDLTSFSIEVPVLFDLDEDLNYPSNVVPEGYTSYFITPSARVTFFPRVPVNPWASVGGGFGHFSESSDLEFGGTNPNKSNTVGVLQFGGGIDIRALKSFSVRGEVRDFYSGTPHFSVSTGKSRQNNLYVGVGLVWIFGGLR